jgi:hypothetical protein
MNMATAAPEQFVSYHSTPVNGLEIFYRAFWQDRAAHEAEVRANLLSLEATRKRHVRTSPDSSQYNPDLWVDEYYFLNRPRAGEYSTGSVLRLSEQRQILSKVATVVTRSSSSIASTLGSLRHLFHRRRRRSVSQRRSARRSAYTGCGTLCTGFKIERNHPIGGKLHEQWPFV